MRSLALKGALVVALVVLIVDGCHKEQEKLTDPRAAVLEQLPLEELAARAGVNPVSVSERDRRDLILIILCPPPGLSQDEVERALAIQSRTSRVREDQQKEQAKLIAAEQAAHPCSTPLAPGVLLDVPVGGVELVLSSPKPFTMLRFWSCEAPDAKFVVEGKEYWPSSASSTAPATIKLNKPTKAVKIYIWRADEGRPGTVKARGITVR